MKILLLLLLIASLFIGYSEGSVSTIEIDPEDSKKSSSIKPD